MSVTGSTNNRLCSRLYFNINLGQAFLSHALTWCQHLRRRKPLNGEALGREVPLASSSLIPWTYDMIRGDTSCGSTEKDKSN